MPSVIAKNRLIAYQRQSGRCYYCDLPMWLGKLPGKRHRPASLQCTAEHLVARQDGGDNSARNIVAACRFLPKHRKDAVFRSNPNRRSPVLLLWYLLFIFVVSQFIDLRFFPLIIGQTWMMLGLVANSLEPDLQIQSDQVPENPKNIAMRTRP